MIKIKFDSLQRISTILGLISSSLTIIVFFTGQSSLFNMLLAVKKSGTALLPKHIASSLSVVGPWLALPFVSLYRIIVFLGVPMVIPSIGIFIFEKIWKRKLILAKNAGDSQFKLMNSKYNEYGDRLMFTCIMIWGLGMAIFIWIVNYKVEISRQIGFEWTPWQ